MIHWIKVLGIKKKKTNLGDNGHMRWGGGGGGGGGGGW